MDKIKQETAETRANAARLFSVWISALNDVGCAFEDTLDPDNERLSKSVHSSWHNFNDFAAWAKRKGLTIKTNRSRLCRAVSGKIGPKNYELKEGRGRPKRYKGVSFEWDPSGDVRSPEGLDRLREAREAGASWRDCSEIFGVDHAQLFRIAVSEGIEPKPKPRKATARSEVADLLG